MHYKNIVSTIKKTLFTTFILTLVIPFNLSFASKVPDSVMENISTGDEKYIVELKTPSDKNAIENKYKDLKPENLDKTKTQNDNSLDNLLKFEIKKNEDLDKLKNDPKIVNIEKDLKRKIFAAPNDSCYTTFGSPCPANSANSDPNQNGQWNLRKLCLLTSGTSNGNCSQSAWDSPGTTGSANTIIAVLDTGIDFNVNTGTGHPDLTANIWNNAAEISGTAGVDDDGNGEIDDKYGWNFADNNNDVSDLNGHGTHVAGIAAGVGNNSLGITGICWSCKIMPVKIFHHQYNSQTGQYEDFAYDSDIVNAIHYAVDNGAKVINMSIGGPGYSQSLQDAVDYAWNHDVLVVSAAGNNGASASDSYPGGLSNSLSVGATNYNDVVDSYSNTGQKLDITAPGTNILSTKLRSISGGCLGNIDYYCLTGTSMASPHVAGVAALIFDKHRSDLVPWTAKQVRYALLKYTYESNIGTNPPTTSFDNTKGFGKLNALRSLSAPTPSADSTPPVATLNSEPIAVHGTWNISGTASDSDLYIYTIGIAKSSDGYILKEFSGRTNVNSATLTSFDTNTLANDNYIVTMMVQDFAGNTTVSNSINVAIDNTAPANFTLSTPYQNSYVNTSKPTLTWNASSSFSALSYDLYVDNNLTAQNLSSTSYTLVNSLSEGMHSWYVKAKNSGYSTDSNSLNFIVDFTAPANFSISANVNGNSVTLTYSTTDSLSGMNRYELMFNGSPLGNRASPYVASGQADGNYTVSVNAYDNAGNVRTSTVTFKIDTRTPYLISKGDVNASGKVDLSDLSIIAQNFNKTTSAGDVNGDGIVNLSDLSILAQDWQKSF